MIEHFKSYFHYFDWDRIQSGIQWEALHWVFHVVTMVTQGFLGDSPVFPAGSSLMRCSHINLILSMFHQFGHIRFLIYVYLHIKQYFLIFYVFVAICFGSSPFFKQTAWTISFVTFKGIITISWHFKCRISTCCKALADYKCFYIGYVYIWSLKMAECSTSWERSHNKVPKVNLWTSIYRTISEGFVVNQQNKLQLFISRY